MNYYEEIKNEDVLHLWEINPTKEVEIDFDINIKQTSTRKVEIQSLENALNLAINSMNKKDQSQSTHY